MADQPEDERGQLVVIGASAGGVEALAALVATLPVDFPAPIVLAQHLDPTRPSHLAEILDRRSTLPVRTVERELHLEPGVVYVVPSNRDVFITDHTVGVQSGGDAGRCRRSTDCSRRRRGSRRAAGRGHPDRGRLGRRGRGQSGQGDRRDGRDPEPRDGILPDHAAVARADDRRPGRRPQDMGRLLQDLVAGAAAAARPEEEQALRPFLEQLRDPSGIDFSSYKMPTIMRRLQRRIDDA